MIEAPVEKETDPKTWVVLDSAMDFGGHQKMVARILEVISRRSNRRICYVLPSQAKRTEAHLNLRVPGIEIHRFESSGSILHRGFLGSLGAFLVARGLLASDLRGGHLILVPGSIQSAMPQALIAKALGLRGVIYTPNVRSMESVGAILGGLRDRLVRTGIGSNQRIIVLNDHQRSELVRRGFEGEMVEKLGNFLDRPVARRARACPSGDGTVRVGVIGRVSFADKGQEILGRLPIDSASRMEFHIVGDGPDLEALRSMTGCREDSRRFTFHGWTDPWELDYDIVLVPSTMEGVPLVVLEAILRSIPVLASDLPETRFLLPERFLFDRGAPESIEKRILELLRSDLTGELEALRTNFEAAYLAPPTLSLLESVFEGKPNTTNGREVEMKPG